MRSDVVIYILTDRAHRGRSTHATRSDTYINLLRELLITSRQQLATEPARNHNELV